MRCSTPEDLAEALEALRGSVSRLLELTSGMLTTPEALAQLGDLEAELRRIPVAGHALINDLAAQSTPAELGGTLGQALADRLRITEGDADRRIADAAELGPRRALTGETLAPLLPATAAAQRRGLVGDAHVKLIRKFIKKLPDSIDAPIRDEAEADLAGKAAAGYRPDELGFYARLLHNYLAPEASPTNNAPVRAASRSAHNNPTACRRSAAT